MPAIWIPEKVWAKGLAEAAKFARDDISTRLARAASVSVEAMPTKTGERPGRKSHTKKVLDKKKAAV